MKNFKYISPHSFNVHKKAKYYQGLILRDNVEHLCCERGYNPCFIDQPQIQTDSDLYWAFPLFNNPTWLYITLTGKFNVSTNDGKCTSTLESYSSSDVLIDSKDILSSGESESNTMDFNNINKHYNLAIPDSGSWAYVKLNVDVQDKLYLVGITGRLEWEDNRFTYNFDNSESYGTIHDEGIFAMYDKMKDLYGNTVRILGNWSREGASYTATPAYERIMTPGYLKGGFPFFGFNKYSSTTSNTFYYAFHVKSLTGTVNYRFTCDTIDGVNHFTTTPVAIPSTGWVTGSFTKTDIGYDMDNSYFIDLIVYAESSNETTIDSVNMWCY